MARVRISLGMIADAERSFQDLREAQACTIPYVPAQSTFSGVALGCSDLRGSTRNEPGQFVLEPTQHTEARARFSGAFHENRFSRRARGVDPHARRAEPRASSHAPPQLASHDDAWASPHAHDGSFGR